MAQKDKSEPKGDRNRIVIEGIDEPKRKKKTDSPVRGQNRTGRQVDVDRELFPKVPKPYRRGKYSDRMRISPFKQGYDQRKGYLPGEGYFPDEKRTARRRLRTRT